MHTLSRITGINFSLLTFVLLFSCAGPRLASTSDVQILLRDSALRHAHVGIHIREAGSGKEIVSYQSDRYFVPASNTKIITLYTSLKVLGDSVEGMRYAETADALYLQPTADPTLLHPDFPKHPVADWIYSAQKPLYYSNTGWATQVWGPGWTWSDYDAYYMPERSLLPVFGNVVRVRGTYGHLEIRPSYFRPAFILAPSAVSDSFPANGSRYWMRNSFSLEGSASRDVEPDIPYITDQGKLNWLLLADSLKVRMDETSRVPEGLSWKSIYSQKTDSLLRYMMLRSDNFYAEQLLLMASFKRWSVADERRIIRAMLQRELSGFPDAPRWADGSGLSRYNLFTPRDFTWLLDRMQREFGMERLKLLFPTGGLGTLRNFFSRETGMIYAKTGTLSGVVSLSGYLYARSGKLLVFSCLVNNHQGSAVAVRRNVESFLRTVREKY